MFLFEFDKRLFANIVKKWIYLTSGHIAYAYHKPNKVRKTVNYKIIDKSMRFQFWYNPENPEEFLVQQKWEDHSCQLLLMIGIGFICISCHNNNAEQNNSLKFWLLRVYAIERRTARWRKTKIPLSQRAKKVRNKMVQRDFYSSFLNRYTDENNVLVRSLCKKNFLTFLERQRDVIHKIRQEGDRTGNFGLADFV